jgi:uncharacterized membrane protein YraQ (UPF0718 family)
MNKKDKRKSRGKWIFLSAVILLYTAIYFISEDKFNLISRKFIHLLIQIIPVMLIVFVLMALLNIFINNDTLKKHMRSESGVKGWLIAISAGILSMGPVYAWYPLMKELQKSGVRDRYLATFLYNRGIKLQWLPMLILYFGLKYSITLLVVMAVLSVPQGIFTEILMRKKS